MIEVRNRITGKLLLERESLREANLCGVNLREADLCGADLYGADLREADLCGANLCGVNLCGVNLTNCKGILSFTGEKHILIYFKHKDTYYFKIGCLAKTKEEWLKEFKNIGKQEGYSNNTQLYGDVIKLFSQYELY